LKLSVVVPAFNEEPNVEPLYARLSQVLASVDAEWEIIFVDDGSSDGTDGAIRRLRRQEPRVKLLTFSRNFGQQVAITAGLDYAEGDAVLVMDADLQHPPELIPQLLARWKDGYEVVFTERLSTRNVSRGESFASRLYYGVFRLLTGIDLPSNAADFRLLDRKVVLAFRQIHERVRFLRGLTTWLGFRSTGVSYQAPERRRGATKYTFTKRLRFAADGILSFSTVPLHLAVYFGFALAGLGFLYAFYALYARFISHSAVSGWTSLMMVSLLIGGIQLVVLGIIGIYLGKLYEESKQRPLYVVKEAEGLRVS
jgi:polyisoprenyl-phosphate glycosyltransferase